MTDKTSRYRTGVADGLAVAASIHSSVATHREYFEFSPRALALLREHGAIPTVDGWFHSLVRDSNHIVGNLDWRKVDLGVDQALSMQTAAVSLALRAAIRDVADAVARVEGKVDKVLQLVRAERLGAVAGDSRTLEPLVAQARALGEISDTNWSTVASLGPQIARDIEALRDYVRREVNEAGEDRRGRSRSAELERLTDDLIGESLALIVLAEQNYAMWEEVKVARVATAERGALQGALDETQARLRSLQQADQELVDLLVSVAGARLEATGYEGFRPVESRRLRQRADEIERSADWFAAQRHLNTVVFDAAYPSLRDSFGALVGDVAGRVRAILPGDRRSYSPTKDD